MTIPVILIFRRKNPVFFSIEAVFDRILSKIDLSQVNVKQLVLPKFGISIINLIWLWKRTRGSKGLFHITGDTHYLAFVLPGSRTVLTIHDCVFLEQNRGLKKWILKKILLDLPVAKCRYITTISEKTKNEIIRYTGCGSGKITVIRNPVSPVVYYEEKIFNSVTPVLLFIGATPNKNLTRVVEALKGVNCILDVVGCLSVEQKANLVTNNIEHRIFSNLSDDEMADRYVECDLVLFPSLYEGFGLPIIEGFKSGRAVITSDRSPMREVAAGAACLVDPENVYSIKEGILRLIKNGEYREGLIARGFEVVKQYTPDVVAGEYCHIYEMIYRESCAE